MEIPFAIALRAKAYSSSGVNSILIVIFPPP